MKVIIAGSRTFDNYNVLKAFCDQSLVDVYVSEFVSGAAPRGADMLGELYAKEKGGPVKRFPADWSTHGLKAGPLRNTQMAEYADILVAFWDGKSRGTSDMIASAKRFNLRLFIYRY